MTLRVPKGVHGSPKRAGRLATGLQSAEVGAEQVIEGFLSAWPEFLVLVALLSPFWTHWMGVW